MNQPVLKAETNWGQPSGIASARESILTALNAANGVGPGDFLRQLREVAKLEINEVATQLGLSKSQVIAIESDDFEKLPAPIYIKGFYRRYCNLLSISADPVVKAYDLSTTKNLPELNRVALKSQMNIRHASIRYIGYIVITLLVLLLLYWLKDVDYDGLMGAVSGGGSGHATNTATQLHLPAVHEPPTSGVDSDLSDVPKK